MHSFEYILIMLGGVLISNLVSRRIPRISTPLVQIGIGIVLTLLPISFEMTLEPELFLVLFIAPLLFEDAKKADKSALWRLKRPILLLAIGLVFATTLAVGFAINLLTPSIPLAAAFALAAALAPTDAVSVASFKETATISDDQENLLKGEALFNDASGIVSFQFAIAAVLTGAFSLVNASFTFLISFFGGLVVGAVFMLLRLRANGIENTTFHVLFEIITPFLIFLIAEALHVSGIIAVVAAGITYSFSRRPQTPSVARHNIVSTSVWAVISFTLNGLVFLILGTQLPSVIRRVWSSSPAADYSLIIHIALILLGILLLRFLWVLVMHRGSNLVSPRFVEAALSEERTTVAKNVTGAGSATGAGSETRTEGATKEGEVNPEEQQESFSRNEIVAEKGEGRKPHSGRAHLHDAVLLSLTGAKGAITLALVLTIPLTLADGSPFPERDLIIFLASGVILLSLLFANFLVPLIAPKKAAKLMPEHEVAATLDIYRMVITRLVDTMQSEQKGATEEVIRQYYERIRKAKKQNTAINERDAFVRMRIIEWERDHTLELIEQDKVSAVTGMFYLDHLSRILARLKHHSTLQWELKGLVEQVRHRLRHERQRRAKGKQKLDRGALREVTRLELRDLTLANYRYVQEKLEELARQKTEDAATTRAAALVLVEFERRVARFDNLGIHRGDSRKEHERQLIEVEARALEYEREAISDALEGKRISRATAKEMRDNVAMMELDIEEQLE